MANANLKWGAPRVNGELLKLGIDVSERTVSRCMPRGRKPPSQTWRALPDNHVGDLVSMDFLTVPTATFRVLFVLGVLAHDRRGIIYFNVTDHPTADWTSQQLLEAIGDGRMPRLLIRGRDKDAPVHRAVQPPQRGCVIEIPEVGGLHHRYERRAA